MTDIQKEYCEEKGLVYIKPENTEVADYVCWLESQILALRIHDVVGRSEQLFCECPNNFELYQETKIYHSSCNKEVKVIRTK